MGKLIITIDEAVFEAVLCENDAPRTCETLRQIAPRSAEVFHAIFSGPVILVGIPELAGLPVETETAYLTPGTVVVHPRHRELGIAYGTTQFKEPLGPVYVTTIGQISSNLEKLAEIGQRVHLGGARKVSIAIEG